MKLMTIGVQVLRDRYPAGTRVELVQMDDPQAPPVGTKGTVKGVDDIGSIIPAANLATKGDSTHGMSTTKNSMIGQKARRCETCLD